MAWSVPGSDGSSVNSEDAALAARAVLYARVSTREQAVGGTSLETQREVCRSFVQVSGWQLVDEFIDEGVSGARSSRPALDLLFEAVHANRVDVVVVAKLD